jgi:hypothetical protein
MSEKIGRKKIDFKNGHLGVILSAGRPTKNRNTDSII